MGQGNLLSRQDISKYEGPIFYSKVSFHDKLCNAIFESNSMIYILKMEHTSNTVPTVVFKVKIL